ncbi:F0F1 ATP synthase subunit B [Proteinivorax hydrogeniformans]|uniref:ATP synthase subunit b n=1 Tax=Proteinivorax hydrogeniformans TaxID=1826727 RepID=A0AAU8HTA1_9FIRM
MLDFLPESILFIFVNIILIYLLLRWLLFKPVNKMLDDRSQRIKRDIEVAENKRKEAEQTQKEFEQKMAKASEEAQAIIDKAVKKGQEKQEELIEEGKKEQSKLLKRAKQEIELERSKAVSQLKDEISTMSLMVAEKIVKHSMTAEESNKLVSEVIEGMEDAYEQDNS